MFTITLYTVLVAHNGFPFDFIFLVAEVKCRKLDDISSTVSTCILLKNCMMLRGMHEIHLLAFSHLSRWQVVAHCLLSGHPQNREHLVWQSCLRSFIQMRYIMVRIILCTIIAYQKLCWKSFSSSCTGRCQSHAADLF